MNGGDPEMKLHHPGCWGAYFAYFENVRLTTSTWCWGGIFSATIHWGKTTCRGQSVKVKKRRAVASAVEKSLDRSADSLFRNLID